MNVLNWLPASDISSLAGLANLVVQWTLLMAFGLTLPRIFKVQHPGVLLFYWRALLTLALCLPWIQPAKPSALASGEIALWFDATANHALQYAASSHIHVLQYLPMIAVLGALFGFGKLGLGLYQLRRWSRDCRPVTQGTAAQAAAQLCGADAKIACSPHVQAPFTFGWLRPIILVPENFEDLQPESQLAILCHELIHVRRRDWLWSLSEAVLRIIFWFHPVVWILLARIDICREQVVDREVVRLTEDRHSYLETLLLIARRLCSATRPEPLSGVSILNRNHLLNRVVHLNKEYTMSKLRMTTTTLTLCALLGLTAAFAVLSFPAIAQVEHADDHKHNADNIQPPKRLSGPVPEYPPQAREDKIEGTVIVEALINKDGVVESTAIQQSLEPTMDQAARDAVAQWQFEPALLDGQPVEVKYHLTINFRLD